MPSRVGVERGTRRGAVVLAVTVIAVLVAVATAGTWMTGARMLRLTDSAGYLGAAENLATGKGPTTPFALPTERATPDQQFAWGDELPLSEWPAGYPVVLAAADRLGADSGTQAARLVSIVALVALAGATMAALALTVGRSPVVLLAGTAIVLVGPTRQSFLGAQSPLGQSPMIMSERVFLPLVVMTLVAAAWPGPRRTRVDRWTLAAVVFGVAAATGTRYIGAVCGVAAALVVVLDRRRSPRFRLVVGAVVLAIGPVIVALSSLGATGSPKRLAWHPTAVTGPLVDQASAWFHIPRGWPFALRLVMVAVLVLGPILATGLRHWQQRSADPEGSTGGDRMELALAGFGGAYVLGLVTTRFLLDAVVLFDQRFLAPVQVSSYLLAIAVGHRLAWGWAAGRAPRWVVDAGVTLVVAVVAFPMLRLIPEDHRYLEAFGDRQAAADADAPLTGLDPSTPVFTNDTAGVWATTGLTAYTLPVRIELTTRTAVVDFDARVDQVVELAERDDVVVYVTTASEPAADPVDYTRRGLAVLAECPDGAVVLGRPGSSSEVAARGGPCRAPTGDQPG